MGQMTCCAIFSSGESLQIKFNYYQKDNVIEILDIKYYYQLSIQWDPSISDNLEKTVRESCESFQFCAPHPPIHMRGGDRQDQLCTYLVVFHVSTHACSKHNSLFWPTWMLTKTIGSKFHKINCCKVLITALP